MKQRTGVITKNKNLFRSAFIGNCIYKVNVLVPIVATGVTLRIFLRKPKIKKDGFKCTKWQVSI